MSENDDELNALVERYRGHAPAGEATKKRLSGGAISIRNPVA